MLLRTVEYYDKRTEKKVALFFLDAKKAFENVNWEFMKILLNKLKLGNNFENAIHAIYTEQNAAIVVNNELSRNIKIQKTTRQGCPLSPLLFIMVLRGTFKKMYRKTKRYMGFGTEVSNINTARLRMTFSLLWKTLLKHCQN